MKQFSVGLVGYGVSGSVFHGPLIRSHPGFKLRKVVSSQPGRVRENFPEVAVVSKIEELIKDPEIDLIVIAGPNSTHFPYAKLSLEARKNIIIEKPFVTNALDGEVLIKLAEKNGLLLSVFQNRRWDGDFLTVKKLVEEKTLGEISVFESHFDRFRPQVKNERWREQKIEGSGILFDLGSHLIDQALELFGTPDSVHSDVQAQRQGAVVDDYFHLVLKYKKMRVILHASSIVKSIGPRFQIHGEKGSFVKYGLDPQENALRLGQLPLDNPTWGYDTESNFGELTLDIEGQESKTQIKTEPGNYLAFYQNIHECLTNKTPPLVTPQSALAGTRYLFRYQCHLMI